MTKGWLHGVLWIRPHGFTSPRPPPLVLVERSFSCRLAPMTALKPSARGRASPPAWGRSRCPHPDGGSTRCALVDRRGALHPQLGAGKEAAPGTAFFPGGDGNCSRTRSRPQSPRSRRLPKQSNKPPPATGNGGPVPSDVTQPRASGHGDPSCRMTPIPRCGRLRPTRTTRRVLGFSTGSEEKSDRNRPRQACRREQDRWTDDKEPPRSPGIENLRTETSVPHDRSCDRPAPL